MSCFKILKNRKTFIILSSHIHVAKWTSWGHTSVSKSRNVSQSHRFYNKRQMWAFNWEVVLSIPLSLKMIFEFPWLVFELLNLPVVKSVALYQNPLITLWFYHTYKIQSSAETVFPSFQYQTQFLEEEKMLSECLLNKWPRTFTSRPQPHANAFLC